jgi:signal transduction histidine kinase
VTAEQRLARRLGTAAIVVLGLAALVVAVYAVVVLALGRAPAGEERSLLLWSMVAAAVAVALAFPVRRRLSAFGRRVMLSERGAADDTVRNFGSYASRSVPLDDLLLQAAESLRTSLGLTSAELWTIADDSLVLRVCDPAQRRAPIPLGATERASFTRPGAAGPAWLRVWLPDMLAGRDDDAPVRATPLLNAGELHGMLVVQRPGGAAAFTDDEDLALEELARQIGMTVHNAKLDSALQSSLDEVRRQAQELRASRARVVEAADAARRQIERDIHDGVQQRLVALAVTVRLIDQLSGRDPARAAALLHALDGDLDDTLQELRDLAHGIYPPLLADKGLAEALCSAARRAALPTEVEATGIGRYSRVVEATAYFCCLEALQNAGKHAGTQVTVRTSVREACGALVFTVADDGAGFDVRATARGAGFTNMSDRLGAVGGTLRVESTPGVGTRVTGTIPLPDPAPEAAG